MATVTDRLDTQEDIELARAAQQAALFLNVSRPYFTRLLEDGKIAYRKVGTHPRIRFEDVVQYKEARQKRSSEALQQLVDQAQELGLGY